MLDFLTLREINHNVRGAVTKRALGNRFSVNEAARRDLNIAFTYVCGQAYALRLLSSGEMVYYF